MRSCCPAARQLCVSHKARLTAGGEYFVIAYAAYGDPTKCCICCRLSRDPGTPPARWDPNPLLHMVGPRSNAANSCSCRQRRRQQKSAGSLSLPSAAATRQSIRRLRSSCLLLAFSSTPNCSKLKCGQAFSPDQVHAGILAAGYAHYLQRAKYEALVQHSLCPSPQIQLCHGCLLRLLRPGCIAMQPAFQPMFVAP